MASMTQDSGSVKRVAKMSPQKAEGAGTLFLSSKPHEDALGEGGTWCSGLGAQCCPVHRILPCATVSCGAEDAAILGVSVPLPLRSGLSSLAEGVGQLLLVFEAPGRVQRRLGEGIPALGGKWSCDL